MTKKDGKPKKSNPSSNLGKKKSARKDLSALGLAHNSRSSSGGVNNISNSDRTEIEREIAAANFSIFWQKHKMMLIVLGLFAMVGLSIFAVYDYNSKKLAAVETSKALRLIDEYESSDKAKLIKEMASFFDSVRNPNLKALIGFKMSSYFMSIKDFRASLDLLKKVSEQKGLSTFLRESSVIAHLNVARLALNAKEMTPQEYSTASEKFNLEKFTTLSPQAKEIQLENCLLHSSDQKKDFDKTKCRKFLDAIIADEKTLSSEKERAELLFGN